VEVAVPQSDILDLAIGLVFVWFLLSMLLSVLNEAFSLVFRVRAKHLWLGVGRLLKPATTPYARRFLDTVIFLPFSRLNKKGFDVRPLARPESSDPALASVPAPPQGELELRLQKVYDTLAPALNDVAVSGRRSKLTSLVGSDFAEAVAAVARHVHPSDLHNAASGLGWTESEQSELTAALEPFDESARLSLDEVEQLVTPSKTDADRRALFTEAAKMITGRDLADFFADNPGLSKDIRRAFEAADLDDKVIAVKSTVEKWFDREMDQLSAMYRRQNRKIMAVLAIPVVLIFQANAIGVVKAVHDDASRRQALTTTALAAGSETSLDDVIKNNCAPAKTGEASPTPTTTPTTTADPFNAAIERFECAGKLVGATDEFGLLPDWDKLRRDHENYWDFLFDDYGWVGRALTVVALLFGAQFWFDALRRLIGIRTLISRSGSASG
jgi:hypothetical protein